MTVLVPPSAFDDVREPRRLLPFDRDRATGMAVTIAIHFLIALAALSAVRVATPRTAQELTVRITPERPIKRVEIKPPSHLAVPTVITAPPPEIVIQPATPAPMAATPPIVVPASPPAEAGPRTVDGAGETRDHFLARLLAQFNRCKQYPRAARQARIQGVVLLHFVMDAQGKVLRAEIAKSSGRPVLDNEALALVARAQPLPALPAEFPTSTLDAVVPIEFSLDG
jgi:protein TonB